MRRAVRELWDVKPESEVKLNIQQALIGYWLDKRPTLSKRTITDYEHIFRRLVQFFGDEVEIGDVTADDIRRFLATMRERRRLGNKSVINYQIALSSLWTWAERELQIKQIIKEISRPRWTPPAIEPLTKSEVMALLAACDHAATWTTRNGKAAAPSPRTSNLRDRALMLVMIDSGVRVAELTALSIADFDNKIGRLHVRHGKGDKSRYLFLGAATQKSLWRYLATRPEAQATEALFCSRSGTPLNSDNVRHLIARCAKRAGIERHVHPHMFRHTFAITFLRNGGSVLELQAMLGHANLETVRIYAKLAQIDLREAQRRASPADNWRL